MGPMVCIWRQVLYQFDVAAQFVRYDDTWLTKLLDQPEEKTLGSLGVTASLNQDVENIAVGVNCPPEPEFLSADRDDSLIDVPLVVWIRSVPSNAVGKMAAKALDPETNSIPADENTAFSKEVFNIGRA
ncbi:hypothetical protein BA011_36825 (plasmid) [Rhizobium leguminosarum]|uniref:Uncharacterized protein n=1 Tax=Rhizobium leguminosarum TaxID=384 RepID=A0A1B1CPL7_RHILE|nr:hypothetical protein BA011_36825 [Rhizobium leguminosarum]